MANEARGEERDMTEIKELIRLAVTARDAAYAPYSGFAVGVALIGDDGAPHAGCNVENASYPMGSCAEAAAIAAMVLNGGRVIRELVLVGPDGRACPPCGGCRQRIREFAGPGTVVHLCSETGVLRTMTMNELLPESFGPENLNQRTK